MHNKCITRCSKNHLLIILMAGMLAITLILMSYPAYRIHATLYTKKSGNTFVGDERYLAARAEVDQVAAEYEKQGMPVQVEETVTERVNSKGIATSMVAFSIRCTMQKTGWQFLMSELSAGKVLLVIMVLLITSMLLMVLGVKGCMHATQRDIPHGKKLLRKAACWLILLALLLTPVFFMTTNVFLSRQLKLVAEDVTVADAQNLLRQADTFLFGGTAGENIQNMVGDMGFETTPSLWVMMPVLMMMLLFGIKLAMGTLGKTVARGLMLAFVVVICIVTLYPYYAMTVTAFQTDAETTDMYFLNLFPKNWRWENLTAIMERGVPRFLLNSLIVASGATALTLVCGVPAAYAMARMKFKGRGAFMAFIIMSQMFSPVVLLVGIAKLMSILGLSDSLLGLIFINAAFNQAFAVWLLRGTFVAISPEMEQAASIDGCNMLSAMIRVLLPMAAPGIVTALIFVFINGWNEYTISTVLISTMQTKPITVGITQFSSYTMVQWNYLFASSLLATIPVVVLFMFIEKHLVGGLTAGGVKG